MGVLLELDRVTKRFGRVTVAEDLSFAIDEGAALGVVGPNGAGKTSLFGLISGDLAPDGGEIRFDGQSVLRLDAARRCRLGIGRTYQVPRPFGGMTVFENVLVAAQQGAGARGRQSYALAIDALARTGLRPEANRLAGSLGLLQRKRLEVARALATRPRLLLLDEVAAGLTDPEVAEVVGIVQTARESGLAVIWIEHVVRALMPTMSRLVCLAGGHVVGDGDPATVLASQAVREVFLGTDLDLDAAARAGGSDAAAVAGSLDASSAGLPAGGSVPT